MILVHCKCISTSLQQRVNFNHWRSTINNCGKVALHIYSCGSAHFQIWQVYKKLNYTITWSKSSIFKNLILIKSFICKAFQATNLEINGPQPHWVSPIFIACILCTCAVLMPESGQLTVRHMSREISQADWGWRAQYLCTNSSKTITKLSRIQSADAARKFIYTSFKLPLNDKVHFTK